MIVTHAILRLQRTKEGLNMRKEIAKQAGFLAIFALLALGLIATGAIAAEVVVEKDTIESVSMEEDFVRTADNFIILFDASGTMQKSYKDTGMIKVDMAKKILQQRNQILPDLGFNAGLYMFTPWKTYYSMQPYDRGKFEQAIEALATEKLSLAYENQPTPLGDAIYNLDPILAKTSGRTAIFIFSDGQHTLSKPKRWPVEEAKEIASKHDVSFYLISSATTPKGQKLLQDIASVNASSRVMQFDDVVDKEEYITGPLYVIKETEVVEAATISRVVGIKSDNILYGFDSHSISPEFRAELDELGEFLTSNPEAYVVLAGHTDSMGPEEYNMWLSHRRAEGVADYLANNFNIDRDRIVVQWYGEGNPIATNDTPEGRSQNRRVVSVVTGMD